MSYWMQQRDANFLIKAQNVSFAYEALRKWANYPSNSYEQVSIPERFARIMKIYEYDVVYDNTTGDCTEIWFDGDRLYDDMAMFEAIAPYVEHGSYIEYIGEDSYLWRWVLSRVNCMKYPPR